MRLKPHEILQHLGFDIGEEGIEVNNFDTCLATQSLKLLASTMNPHLINDEDLKRLHVQLAGLVAMHRNEKPVEWSNDSAEELKGWIESVIKITFKFNWSALTTLGGRGK